MARGRSNETISMIEWIRTGGLSIQKSLSLARTASGPHAQRPARTALALTQACPPQDALSLSLPRNKLSRGPCASLCLKKCMPPLGLPTWIGWFGETPHRSAEMLQVRGEIPNSKSLTFAERGSTAITHDRERAPFRNVSSGCRTARKRCRRWGRSRGGRLNGCACVP